MSLTLRHCLFFFGAISALWFLWLTIYGTEMDSLDTPFSIEINGHPIAKVSVDAEDRTQAKTGTEAAIFTLKDKHLQSGDYILGRSVTEDRSFLPKQVLWFKNTEENHSKVQPVTAQEKGESYQLKFTSMSWRTLHTVGYANTTTRCRTHRRRRQCLC